MDRDTLQDDLDLILERSRDDKLPGEWGWEPPRYGRPGGERGHGAERDRPDRHRFVERRSDRPAGRAGGGSGG